MKLIHYLPLFLAAATTASALTEEKGEQKRDVAPGGTLVVDVDFGTIDVTGGDNKQVVVNAERRISGASEAKEKEFLEASPITVTQEGNTVTVRARRPKTGGWLANWGNSWNTEARYTILVPTNFNAHLETSGGKILVSELTGDVNANTSGGTLNFAKIRGPLKGETSGGAITTTDCDGEIQIETSGGKIDVGGGSGSLTASTSGGSIAVRNFGGSAKVETSGGGLRFENVRGSLHGETSGGSISASLPAPVPGDVRLETSAGRIEVSVPANAALNLDASTSMGRVTSDLPVAVQGKQDSDRMRGTINGGGKLLVLRTSAGSISVKQGGAPATAKP